MSIFSMLKRALEVIRQRARTKNSIEEIEVYDRYDALGVSRPDPETVCLGQCEGTGWVPINKDDMEEPWHTLWMEAEKESPSDDGWHFVKCPDCKGTGLRGDSQ